MTATASDYVTFTGVKGSNLAARLDRPVGEARAYALFVHCFACAEDGIAASRISTALAERGIAVLRFDFTGLGSEGSDFASTSYASNVLDLVTAADYLRQYHRAPELLIGHSLGGTAALAAAAVIPELKAVATIGAPSGAHGIGDLVRDSIGAILDVGEAAVRLSNRDFPVSLDLLEDMNQSSVLKAVEQINKPLVVFHATGDEVVSVDNADGIFQAAHHPKSFVSLDGADHLLTRQEDAVYVGEVIASWALRTLGAAVEVGSEVADAVAAPGVVVVSENGDGRLSRTVTVGRHILRGDEPVAYGGTDSGPSPYEYLLTALGTCTSITLRQQAEQENLPLERVAVRLSHPNVHAEDCQTCVSEKIGINAIERQIFLAGDLDTGARARLLEIADRSPVHQALQAAIRVVTRLEGESL
ncbi:MAG: alpha/beta fold hydrolase [Alphaproteobacteria bacterium]